MNKFIFLCLLTVSFILPSASSGETIPNTVKSYRKLLTRIPNTKAGMLQLATLFVTEGVNKMALTKVIVPGTAEYTAFFKYKEIAEYAKKYYDAQWKKWNKNDPGIDPGMEKTNIKIYSATVKDIVNHTGKLWVHFTLLSKGMWPYIKEKYIIYKCYYKKPGKKYGFRISGFTHVNGRWTIFPKMKRVLRIIPKKILNKYRSR